MPIEIAGFVVAVFEAYIMVGAAFALLFLPRAIARMDPRVQAAPRRLRLLLCPGIAALWPLFAWRWLTGSGEPTERNAHRDQARQLVMSAGGAEPAR